MNAPVAQEQPAAPTSVGKAAARVKAITAAAVQPPATAPVADAPAVRVIGQVAPGTLRLIQYANNDWTGLAPRDCEPEDLHLNPAPFELLPNQVARFDTLRLVDPGDKWVAWYACVEALTGHKVFALLNAIRLPSRVGDASDRVPAGFEVVQGGPGDEEGWLVRRVLDGVILNRHRRTPTREDGIRFLLSHAAVRGEVHQSIHCY